MAALTAIEGIGASNAAKLEAAGIRGTGSLLSAATTKKGRIALAKRSGISEKLILEWINRADLMRVRGVGEQFSDLLEQAGVDSVKGLRRRKPSALHAKMIEVNHAGRQRFVRREPSLGEVERWIEHAKTLDAVVSH